MLPKTDPKPYIRLESEPTELSGIDYFTWEQVTKVTVSLSEKEENQGIKVVKRQTLATYL